MPGSGRATASPIHIALAASVSWGLACSSSTSADARPRTFRMGFSAIPPRPDPGVVLPALNLSSLRADAAIMHIPVPWVALLGGTTAKREIDSSKVGLADYYRAKGMRLVITVDVTDGLDRAKEAPELVALGRSITDPAIQRLYHEYVLALDTILHPDYLGLAAETNLIRLAAADSVYRAVVTMANAAAADVNAAGTPPPLYVSVQVEVAWGRATGGAYLGITQDVTDFRFLDALGLSSYPYLGGFSEPEDLPSDYYSRLVTGLTLPELVVESGWTSVSLGGITSSRQKQARYLTRQAQLLDSARAVALFQLTFADFDLSAIPLPSGSNLPLFAHLGVVDSTLGAKPALAVWDGVFARPLAP